jgi:hypothetical protein
MKSSLVFTETSPCRLLRKKGLFFFGFGYTFSFEEGNMRLKNLPVKPAYHLIETPEPVFTRLGGLPLTGPDFTWPEWKNRALAFVMQIRFSEINATGAIPFLPKSGLLYVFYDAEQSTWGFDPEDRGSWKMLFQKDETEALQEPPVPATLPEWGVYPAKQLAPKLIQTYPEWEAEAYAEMSHYGDLPRHHLGGWANPIQNPDMALECQLASNGLYCGNSTGYQSPRAAE